MARRAYGFSWVNDKLLIMRVDLIITQRMRLDLISDNEIEVVVQISQDEDVSQSLCHITFKLGCPVSLSA